DVTDAFSKLRKRLRISASKRTQGLTRPPNRAPHDAFEGWAKASALWSFRAFGYLFFEQALYAEVGEPGVGALALRFFAVTSYGEGDVIRSPLGASLLDELRDGLNLELNLFGQG